MGKINKRKHPDMDEILARPWCYYCERDFDDLKILINHQKAKHYKCERCGRRLNTAGGLSVHMTQVHKETLGTIENALPNRAGLEVEIFGMEGVPEDTIQTHNQRLLQQYAQAEAERRAATGNPAPGVPAVGGALKKPKFETPSDLKKRLAEHKAKKAAEEAAGINSDPNTPGPGETGDDSQSPAGYHGSGSPLYGQQQSVYGAPPNGTAYQAQPQAQPQTQPFMQPHPPQSPFQQQHPPQFQQQAPPQFQKQGPPPFQHQQPPFSPPGMPQTFHNQAFSPPPQFQGPPMNQGPQMQQGPTINQGYPPFPNGPPQFHNGPPLHQSGPPQYQNGPPAHLQTGPYQNGPGLHFGPGSPQPFQQTHNQFQPPRHNTPPQYNTMPTRPPSLPSAPGLPQRPAFGAPPVNAQQMQQMHQGQLSAPPGAVNQQHTHPGAPPGMTNTNGFSPVPLTPQTTPMGANLPDDVVSGVAIKSEQPNPVSGLDEKKGKKEKDKNAKLVYSDNEWSPEEKMAKLPRYAFVPSG